MIDLSREWITDISHVRLLLEDRWYARGMDIPHLDLIVGIDIGSLGIGQRFYMADRVISKTWIQHKCAACGKVKISVFGEFAGRGRGHICISCATRHVNLEHRDYGDPVWLERNREVQRGRKMSDKFCARRRELVRNRPRTANGCFTVAL